MPNRLKGNLKLISSNKVKFVEGPEQEYRRCLTLSLPNLAESFHLNGHIIGFHPQTQKLESPHETLSSTLAVKGLRRGGKRARLVAHPIVP